VSAWLRSVAQELVKRIILTGPKYLRTPSGGSPANNLDVHFGSGLWAPDFGLVKGTDAAGTSSYVHTE
jgi:hypothetical protein